MDKYNFYNSDYSNSPYFRMENPKKIEFTKNFIDSMYQQLKNYEEIIAELKSDLAEKKTVKKAIEERDKAIKEKSDMAKQLYYGLTKDDIDRGKCWWQEHTKEERTIYSSLPKTFHRITYKLYPTELGMIKTIECSCGQSFDITKDEEFG